MSIPTVNSVSYQIKTFTSLHFTTSNDDIKKMTSLANFMENVEVMIDPNQNSRYRSGICEAVKTKVSEDIGGHNEDEDMKKRCRDAANMN